MKLFLRNIVFFTVGFLAIMMLIIVIMFNLYGSGNFKRSHNSDTESNIMVIGKNENFGHLILGISHARNFSRHDNHQRIESILEEKIINIGIGRGKCGLNEQLFYLNYFYNQQNTTDTVLIVASPPLFLSDHFNRVTDTFNAEPLNVDFIKGYLVFKASKKWVRIRNYVFSKSFGSWISFDDSTSNDQVLDAIDTQAIQDGYTLAYLDDAEVSLKKNRIILNDIIKLAILHESKVIMFIPPAVFGKWPGHEKIISMCEEMQKKYGVEYYDFSESVLELRYYYDHHHLNTEGVVYFVEEYLKDVVD